MRTASIQHESGMCHDTEHVEQAEATTFIISYELQ